MDSWKKNSSLSYPLLLIYYLFCRNLAVCVAVLLFLLLYFVTVFLPHLNPLSPLADGFMERALFFYFFTVFVVILYVKQIIIFKDNFYLHFAIWVVRFYC